MEFSELIETDRLSLRKVEAKDWPALLEVFCSKEFPSRLPLSMLTTKEKVQSWINDRIKDWKEGSGFVWSVEHSLTGQVIGQISISPRESDYALAYWVKPDFWSNGYATEACTNLIEHVREFGDRDQIWAGSATWNTASSSVLIKLRFRSIGTKKHTLINGIEEQIIEYILAL